MFYKIYFNMYYITQRSFNVYAAVNKIDNKINLFAQEEDLCYICSNLEVCPLLAAIQDEAVVLRYENVEVEKCGMYKEISLDEIMCFD